MAKAPRTHQKALCYYISNQGVQGRPLFVDDADRTRFTQTVVGDCAAYRARVFHWAWMADHYHLLAEVAYCNLRPLVSGIQQSYAQYYHARHGTSGKFWQQRFQSTPVEPGAYLMRAGRYVERCAVRNGTAAAAEEYGWSSAAFYALGHMDGVTSDNPYAETEDLAFDREQYRAALATRADDEWMASMKSRNRLGSAAFCSQLKLENGRFRRRRGRPRRQSTTSPAWAAASDA